MLGYATGKRDVSCAVLFDYFPNSFLHSETLVASSLAHQYCVMWNNGSLSLSFFSLFFFTIVISNKCINMVMVPPISCAKIVLSTWQDDPTSSRC